MKPDLKNLKEIKKSVGNLEDSLKKLLDLSDYEFNEELIATNTRLLFDSMSGKVTEEQFKSIKACIKQIIYLRKIKTQGTEVLIPTYPQRGWLRPYLFDGSRLFDGRWDYWYDCLLYENIPKEIPQIDFAPIYGQSGGHGDTVKHIEECLTYIERNCGTANSLNTLVSWLLWGFDEHSMKDEEKTWNDKVDRWLYENFQLGRLQQHPGDYFGYIAANNKGNSRWSNPNAFYPTPMQVCSMMAQMAFCLPSPFASVCDPCCGTGGLLMAASNYSVNLHGCDIDYALVRMCLVNGWLYMPWLVKPAPWLKMQKMEPETPKEKSCKKVFVREKEIAFEVGDDGQMSMF